MALTRIVFFIILISLFQTTFAEETDQFTLPPKALEDIGPIASLRLYKVLESVIAQTNSEIRHFESKAKYSHHAASQLALRRQGTYLADMVYKKTGPGYPRWLRDLPSSDKAIFYKERLPWKTIYWLTFSQSPLSLTNLAPSINMYNSYFGTDKLGHFFMMGHSYYKIHRFLIDHGKSPQYAHEVLVNYGKFLELSYLGVLINGVYSNGDLAANYAGWKFYSNLTQSISIGDKTLPPILVLNHGLWEFSKHIDKEALLKPFISDNLNEAYNPCRYTFMRGQIRRQVKKRCQAWIAQGLTKQLAEAKLKESRLWHGETYGHWLPLADEVSLRACFR